MRETAEHFALECGPTKQILTILGIDLTGVCGLPSILDEAKNRCSFHKKKAWDMVVTALFWSIWLSRNRKVFDDVEIPGQIAVGHCMDCVRSRLIGLRSTKKQPSNIGFLKNDGIFF
jgi:hypothetical protein